MANVVSVNMLNALTIYLVILIKLWLSRGLLHELYDAVTTLIICDNKIFPFAGLAFCEGNGPITVKPACFAATVIPVVIRDADTELDLIYFHHKRTMVDLLSQVMFDMCYTNDNLR